MVQNKKPSALKVIISRDKLTASICLLGKNDLIQNLDSDSDVVDYRETSTLISVEAGAQLAEVYPPVPGKEGTAVTGEAVKPPKSKEIR